MEGDATWKYERETRVICGYLGKLKHHIGNYFNTGNACFRDDYKDPLIPSLLPRDKMNERCEVPVVAGQT